MRGQDYVTFSDEEAKFPQIWSNPVNLVKMNSAHLIIYKNTHRAIYESSDLKISPSEPCGSNHKEQHTDILIGCAVTDHHIMTDMHGFTLKV